MDLIIKNFLYKFENISSKSFGKELVAYILFEKLFCKQHYIHWYLSNPLEGSLTNLFCNTNSDIIIGYDIKSAAITFDSYIPWDEIRENKQVENLISKFREEIDNIKNIDIEWFESQIYSLLHYSDNFNNTTITPPFLCKLISKLASNEPIGAIADICCGSFSLGLELFHDTNNEIFCVGEDNNPFICAFTRIYFYLCNIKKFKLYETNVLDIEKRPFNNDIKNCVFLCDLPLVGNKTIPIFDDSIFTKKNTATIYSDWAFICSILRQMNEHDKAFVIVTKGALVRKNEEFIRKYFVEENLLDAVISLPTASNSGRSVPIELLIIQKKPKGKAQNVLFADFSKWSLDSVRDTHSNFENIINKCNDIYIHRSDYENISKTISLEEISETGYNLYPPVYIDISSTLTENIKLKDIAEVTRGIKRPSYLLPPGKSNAYLINIRDMNNDTINYGTADCVHEGYSYDSKYLIQEDDIIITSKGSSVKFAIIPPNPPKAYISGNLTIIRVNKENYSPYVLFEYLISDYGKSQLNIMQTGTTINIFNKENLENLFVPKINKLNCLSIGENLKKAKLDYNKTISEAHTNYLNKKNQLLQGVFNNGGLK